MTPFECATVPPEEIQRNIDLMFEQWKDVDSAVRHLYPEADPAKAKQNITETINRMMGEDMIFLNDIYQVNIREPEDGLLHLSIKRIDKNTIHDWRELQAIKNELVGPENEAVEIYPAESRLVDTANQYHLWVFKCPKYRIPFGFNSGRVVSDKVIGKSVNRPFVTSPVVS